LVQIATDSRKGTQEYVQVGIQEMCTQFWWGTAQEKLATWKNQRKIRR